MQSTKHSCCSASSNDPISLSMLNINANLTTAPHKSDAVLKRSIVVIEAHATPPPLAWKPPRLRRAWEILESRHGRAHPDVGAACISLGNLAVIRRRQDEAVDWFRRALGTFEVRIACWWPRNKVVLLGFLWCWCLAAVQYLLCLRCFLSPRLAAVKLNSLKDVGPTATVIPRSVSTHS